jgi:hypothetical protein
MVAPQRPETLSSDTGTEASACADATQVGGSHYKDMAIQPWAVMQSVLTHAEFVGFLKGNVLKYSLRAGKKPGASDDSEKAQHYAQKLKEVQA